MIDDDRPSWYWICASYIRSFRRSRHELTSTEMPQDRRIVLALRKLYSEADSADREFLRGEYAGSRSEKKQRQNRLIAQLAVRAGLTAFAIVPEMDAENKREMEEETL